jgi:hypothetical protein
MKLLGFITVDVEHIWTTDQMFCIRQIQWDNTPTIYVFKKAHDSVRTEVPYSICIEFGTYMKLIRLV